MQLFFIYSAGKFSYGIEDKLPWIWRRLKKRSYRVEKYRNIFCCFNLYQKITNSIFGNSFNELERDVNDLQSEDKLSSLLQGLLLLFIIIID